MNITKHYFIFLSFAIMALSACEKNTANKNASVPNWPEEEVFVYDTVDCSDLCCVPAQAITVRQAVEIGKALGSGKTTNEKYYIKGLVKSFNTSKHESGIKDHGNGYFYIQDNTKTNIDFYGYQVMGLKGAKMTSLDQLQIGDFVVIYSKISNYNGTIETESKGAAYIACSSNALLYPEKDVAYYEETFENGLGNWTCKTVTDPGITVWKHLAQEGGTTSAIAQAIDDNDNKYTSEVWLVSPEINLKQYNTNNVKLHFSTYYQGSPLVQDAPAIQDLLRLKVKKENSDWVDFEIPHFNSGKLPQYKQDTIDISAYVGAKTQIAFAYKSESTSFVPKWSVTSIKMCERKHTLDCK